MSEGNTRPHISHELRTPMNHVIGYGELLLEDVQDAGLDEAAQQIRDLCAAGRQLLTRLNAAFADRSKPAEAALLAAKADLRAGADEITERAQAVRPRLGPAQQADVERIEAALVTFRSLIEKFSLSAAAPAAERRPSSRPVVPGPNAARILVVDDEEANRAVLLQLLTRLGHRVELATNGQEALERLRTGTADLILLDLMMPVMDGKEFLRQLKADPVLGLTPVIIVSAVDEVRSVTEAIESGADDYLTKPYDAVLLRTRVNVGLERGRQRKEDLRFREHVALLIYAARAVEEETFEPDLLAPVVEREDALGDLARVFTRMAHEIYQREVKLRERSTALAVEINADQRQRQVEAITSTEFFQMLKARTSRLNG